MMKSINLALQILLNCSKKHSEFISLHTAARTAVCREIIGKSPGKQEIYVVFAQKIFLQKNIKKCLTNGLIDDIISHVAEM